MVKKIVIERSDGRKKEYATDGNKWVAIVYDVDDAGARKDLQAIVNGKVIWSII